MLSRKNCEYIFTWRIENYSSYYHTKGDLKRIDSPVFSIESLSTLSEWYLSLYPKGKVSLKDVQKFVPCYLSIKPLEVDEILDVAFNFEILDEMDNIIVSTPTSESHKSFSFSNTQLSWGDTELIRIEELAKEMDSWKDDILTVRCRIQFNSRKKRKVSESEAKTTIHVDRRFFEWDVKIPVLLEYSESMDFSLFNSHSFEITLFQNMTIFFCFKNHVSRPVKFKIAVYDKHGNKITSKKAEHLFKSAETWEFPQIITKEVLEICKVDLNNCEFKLKGEVCIPTGTTSNNNINNFKFRTSACVDLIVPNCSAKSMQTDFQNLYNDKKYSDITIQVPDGIFHAHKLVLRTRSPLFADMIDKKFLESETGVVDLSDEFDYGEMGSFLEFLYKGTIGNPDPDLFYSSGLFDNLMLAAINYEIPELMDVCISFLKSVMSIDNILDIISIASKVDCVSLKSCAFSFIKLNAAKIIRDINWPYWVEHYKELTCLVLSTLSDDLLLKCN